MFWIIYHQFITFLSDFILINYSQFSLPWINFIQRLSCPSTHTVTLVYGPLVSGWPGLNQFYKGFLYCMGFCSLLLTVFSTVPETNTTILPFTLTSAQPKSTTGIRGILFLHMMWSPVPHFHLLTYMRPGKPWYNDALPVSLLLLPRLDQHFNQMPSLMQLPGFWDEQTKRGLWHNISGWGPSKERSTWSESPRMSKNSR